MSSFSEGQTHQLMEALEKDGWTPEDVTRLGQFQNLSGIRAVIRGHAEVKEVEHLINLDAPPFCPEGFEVVEHNKGGVLRWNSSKVGFYLSPRQQEGKWLKGTELREELKDQPTLNANLLDYLLVHPNLIPEEWKGKYIFFWGTTYRGPYGFLFVRYLEWNGGQWFWDFYWLGSAWYSADPALVRAS